MNEVLRSDEPIGYEFQQQTKVEGEQALPAEETIGKFAELVRDTERLAVVTDLDGTVVPYEANPNDCRINEEAHHALLELHRYGVGIIAMTGRSGAEGARLLQVPGARIIGTSGWEVYTVDENDPSKGESVVHEKFQPYAEQVTYLLHEVRTQFFRAVIEALGEEVTTNALTNEIETADGTIVFERKAVSEQFPEGLEVGLNLNRYDPEKWNDMIALVTQIYNANVAPEIREMITLTSVQSTIKIDGNRELPVCGVGIGPHGGEGKDKSLIRILRETEGADPAEGEVVPSKYDGLLFFGDSNQDAKALRAAHLSAVLAGRRSAGIVVARPESQGQERALRSADVQTGNIAGNAQLLSRLSEMVAQKALPAPETSQ